MAQAVRFEVSTGEAQVAPGGSLRVHLTITNTSSVVDRFAIAVSGVPADWYTLDQSTISLFPGASEGLLLTVHPPADRSATAGAHPITLTATSEDNGSQTATCQVAVTVTPRGDLRLGLTPTAAR